MKFCRECGREVNEKAVVCPNCGCETGNKRNPLEIKIDNSGEKVYSKLVVLLLWIFLGGIGAHRFYVGDVTGGVVMLLSLIFSWLIIPAFILVVMLIIDLVTILVSDTFANKKISW